MSSRLVARARQLACRAPFETAVLCVATLYVLLELSPSSYALALDQLGQHESPLVGVARPIRSDEWSVMTPLFQAAVQNDFHETNATSFYGETLRNFIGLPILNWGLLFKPLVWPFFVVPPALAYSFFWAANAALMLIGWSLLLRVFGFSRRIAALASALLYFSPFVQAWSGPSTQLSLFPWIVLCVAYVASPFRVAISLAFLVPVWLIGMFYAPGVPPLLFLALALCLAFRAEVFRWPRIAGVLVGLALGALVAGLYFAPVLTAYADSVYPGHRWTTGGGMPLWQVASQFLPGTTTEAYTSLIGENISEVATVASWLPLLVLCMVDYRTIWTSVRADRKLARDLRSLAILVAAWALLTAWQLIPLSPLSYLFGLGLSPENRTLFASGTLLLLAAALAVDRLPLVVTFLRASVFAGVVVTAWLLAREDLGRAQGIAVRDELFVLPLVVALGCFVLVLRRPLESPRTILPLIALVPVILGWGFFNPIQSTRVMFRKPDTPVTRRLDAIAATRPDGAIAVTGYQDAILNGVGYRSVTHVIATPSPGVFRTFFPTMPDERFERIFNRYAHVSLTSRARPFVAGQTAIRVPLRRMAHFAATSETARP